jgi:hypothetical protein
MHFPTSSLEIDLGRPAPEPRVVPGSPSDRALRALRAAGAPGRGMLARGLAGLRALLKRVVAAAA